MSNVTTGIGSTDAVTGSTDGVSTSDAVTAITVLNEEQQEVATHSDGNLMVLAGAGTGKTTCLVHRFINLVKQGTHQDKILCLTFTKASADEMKTRIKKELNEDVRTIGTFHGVAYNIVRENYSTLGYEKTPTVVDDRGQHAILKALVPKMENIFAFIANTARESMQPYGDYLEGCKNALSEQYTPVPIGKVLQDKEWTIGVLETYEEELKKRNAVDFSAMLQGVVTLFQDKSTLRYYKSKYRHIMVDEFQDTNRIQNEILMKLHNYNVCVVGDDAQSIYGWRGAFPDIFEVFQDKVYPKVVTLKQTYRFHEDIGRVAHSVITNNLSRYDKELICHRAVDGDVTVLPCKHAHHECKQICRIIRNKVGKSAILMRMNVHLNMFMCALTAYGIPFTGGDFFYYKEIKDLWTIYNIWKGNTTIEHVSRLMRCARDGDGKAPRVGSVTLSKLKEPYLDSLIALKPHLAYIKSAFVDNSDSDDSDKQGDDNRGNQDSGIGNQNLNSFEDVLTQLNYASPTTEQARERYYTFLEITKRYDFKELKAIKGNSDPVVHLSTIHGAKGLEWDNVYVAGCVEGVLPSRKGSICEERRLFYVAITRAKRNVILTYPEVNQWGRSTTRSRFLSECYHD